MWKSGLRCDIKISRNMHMLLMTASSAADVLIRCMEPIYTSHVTPVQCHSPAKVILETSNAYATAVVWLFIQRAWQPRVLELEK